MVRPLLFVLGIVATAIGLIGVVVPLLPTTPFLVVAAGLFLHSSERLHRWLTEHPRFGKSIIRLRKGRGLTVRTKIASVLVAAAVIGAFAVFATDSPVVRSILAAVIVAKIVVMARIPTYVPDGEADRGHQRRGGFRIRADRTLTGGVLALGIAAAGANVAFAVALGHWAASGLVGVTVAVPTAVAVLLLLRAGLTVGAGYVGSLISTRAREYARDALFRVVGDGGPDLVREQGVGAVHALLNDRVEALDPYFSLYLPQLFVGLLAPVAVVGYLTVVDLQTGLILLAVLPVVPLLLGLVQKRFRVVGERYTQASAELSALYLESLRGLSTLTLFSRIAGYGRLLRDRSAALRSRTVRLLATNQLALLLVELFFSLTVVAVSTALGIVRYQTGALPVGVAFAMPLVAIELTRPINLVGAFFFAGAIGRRAKRTIEEFVAEHGAGHLDHRTEGLRPIASDASSTAVGLVMNRVRFAYPAAPDRVILDDFSLTVRPGEIIGLAGPSGVGKTTVSKLLIGLYHPQGGGVTVDGVDLVRLTRDEIASRISYLPQRPYLFSGTLKENLCLGRPDAPLTAVTEAVATAGLDPFLRRLALGLDHPIGEDGVTVSGGERTRIAIARALVMGSRYLVLDEPTAEMDSLLEAGVWNELRRLATSVGIVVVAHRRSTLAACDRVVRLEPVQSGDMREQYA